MRGISLHGQLDGDFVLLVRGIGIGADALHESLFIDFKIRVDAVVRDD
jgi:hypothetical protein